MRRLTTLMMLTCLASPALANDVDGDGQSDVRDLYRLTDQVRGAVPADGAGDLNGDGETDVRDIVLLLAPLTGCEADVDCGPGFRCDAGRCFERDPYAALAAPAAEPGPVEEPEPVDEPEPIDEPEPAQRTCCASAAARVSALARRTDDVAAVSIEGETIVHRFVAECAGDDPRAWFDEAYAQPVHGLIELRRVTADCPDLRLDGQRSGVRVLEDGVCEVALAFAAAPAPPANTHADCEPVELIGGGPGEPPLDEPGPGSPDWCGGLPQCLAIEYAFGARPTSDDYARELVQTLFPDERVAEVDDGETRLRLSTAAGGQLVIYKPRGVVSYQNARLGRADFAADDMDAEQAVEAALAFLNQPVFDRALDGAVLTAVYPETARDPDGRSVVNAFVVRYTFTANASVDPVRPAFLPIIGQEIVVRIGQDGSVLGLEWDRSPLEPIGEVEVLDRRQIERWLMHDDPETAHHPGVIPADGPLLHYVVPGVTSAADGPELIYPLDPHPTTNVSRHSHNLRTYAPGTFNRLDVRIDSPVEALGPEGPLVDLDGPVRFEAAITGGAPPYTTRWRLETAAAGAYGDDFSTTTPTTLEGNPVEAALAPDQRTVVRVIVTDSRGREASDQRLIVTGFETISRTDDAEPTANDESPGSGDEAGEVPEARGCPAPADLPTRAKVAAHGWTFTAEVSADDGLDLGDVRFRGSSLAARMTLPYYTLETLALNPARCELGTHRDPVDPTCRPVLLEPGLSITRDRGPADAEGTGVPGTLRSEGRVTAKACWCVENLPDAGSTMTICQSYVFHAEGEGCSPDPTGIKCAKWAPLVEYAYETEDPNNPFLELTAVQRLDYDMDARVRPGDRRLLGLLPAVSRFEPVLDPALSPIAPSPVTESDGDIATFNRDHDSILVVTPGVGLGPVPPLQQDQATVVADFGRPGQNDAVHQLGQARGTRTTVFIPGCTLIANHLNGFQCHHAHWRWGRFIDDYLLDGGEVFGRTVPGFNAVLRLLGRAAIPAGSFGNGNVLVPSSQHVKVYVNAFRPGIDPIDVSTVVDPISPTVFNPDGVPTGVSRQTEAKVMQALQTALRGYFLGSGFGPLLDRATEETLAMRLARTGLNLAGKRFFEFTRLNVKGQDLVTWHEITSRRAGTRQQPEVLMKNAHLFFR